jgi:tRNA threonylcarbamoyl adenosine modification protein YeaZ
MDVIPASVFMSFISEPKDLLCDKNSSINEVIMNFLSIDCSTDSSSLFIKYENNAFSKILQSVKSSNDLLMHEILDFFIKNKLKFDDIDQIFVNQGPGNFSNLRTSLSIAKGVSISKNLNLYGYNTFLWSCTKVARKKNFIFSIIEFRKNYFVQKFDKNLNIAGGIQKVTKKTIITNYYNEIKVIPKIMAKNFDKDILSLNNLTIADLDHNELESLKLKGLLDKDLIKPLYLS